MEDDEGIDRSIIRDIISEIYYFNLVYIIEVARWLDGLKG